jgi:hypothetical protein
VAPILIGYLDFAAESPAWFIAWPDGKVAPLDGILESIGINLIEFLIDIIQDFDDAAELDTFAACWSRATDDLRLCSKYERKKIAMALCRRVVELNAEGNSDA